MYLRNTVLALSCLAVVACPGSADAGSKVDATLNSLHLAFDADSGGIIEMSYAGPGKMVGTTPDQCGLVDLAYPVKGFEPMRLANRFTKGARIEVESDRVTIRIPSLGPSRTGFPIGGAVSAVVSLKADSDGRSVVMSCEVANNSDLPVRQAIFPDIFGLLPFAGKTGTLLKTCGCDRAPFAELAPTEESVYYHLYPDTMTLTSGGYFNDMITRWLDVSGYQGGFSLFPRKWGSDPQTTTMLRHFAATGRIRLMSVHPVEIAPGKTWSSGEYVLTPHTQSWAKGIEVYRGWVKQNLNRRFPMPKHVREGLGYRTCWMCNRYPDDPLSAIWRMKDLPSVAKDMKEVGLDELVLQSSSPDFELPIPPPWPRVGTVEEKLAAVRECRKLGVNVSQFISVLDIAPGSMPRYGLTTGSSDWIYHPELIPRNNPGYAKEYVSTKVDLKNTRWQQDVLDSCKGLIDQGMSISWDVYLTNTPDDPVIFRLTSEIRRAAQATNPAFTFSGEELWNMELDAEYMDYLWDYGLYRDCQAFTNAFPAPRIMCMVDKSPYTAKRGFMDSLYLNVWPTKPDGVNGDDMIASHPELVKALKQCSKLRRQFLPYFTEGILIGDCVLTEACPGARVVGYVLPDRILVIVMNEGAEREVTLKYDISPWVKSPSHRYEMKTYDTDGSPTGTGSASSRSNTLKTPPLKTLDFGIYAFIAK